MYKYNGFRVDKTSHVTPQLKKLYWLPISYHILFKFFQTTYLLSLINTSSLIHRNRLSIASICPKKAIGSRRGLQWLLPLNEKDSHNQSDHSTQ